jgi:predicted TIM-barrel fold metal-dependent hydrolase
VKNGHRFVDCDMHVIEPRSLFEDYLDPRFESRVTTPHGPSRAGLTPWLVDGAPMNLDAVSSQYNRLRAALLSKRARNQITFAAARDFDAEAQLIAMEMEGIDIAVLFPTAGLTFMARENLDPPFALALCQAYNDWIAEFCRHSPDQLKMVAMLPPHDVNLCTQELERCVKSYGAVGAFMRPNYMHGRYWHSNYWTPLYGLLEELGRPLCFHETTGSYVSSVESRYGENRLLRHVASHPTEMQLLLVALVLGGVLEFHPRLKVAFLEAQSWWVPGLLNRMAWDLELYRDADAPFLKKAPMEYWQRNCFASVEGSEADVGATVAQLGGPQTLCVSTDYPHFDSSFPAVSDNVLCNPSIDAAIGGEILAGGARLYGFSKPDFDRADAAVARRRTAATQRADHAASIA